MDYQIPPGEVFVRRREVMSLGMSDFNAVPQSLAEHPRDLYRTDILLDRMVGTGLGDQNTGVRRKCSYPFRARRHGIQIPLLAGEQYRERG